MKYIFTSNYLSYGCFASAKRVDKREKIGENFVLLLLSSCFITFSFVRSAIQLENFQQWRKTFFSFLSIDIERVSCAWLFYWVALNEWARVMNMSVLMVWCNRNNSIDNFNVEGRICVTCMDSMETTKIL